jgi:hypothetical protein
LAQQFDGKADVSQMQMQFNCKADLSEIESLQEKLNDFEEKIKHTAIYMTELSNIMLPSQGAGKFNCNEDLNQSLKKR